VIAGLVPPAVGETIVRVDEGLAATLHAHLSPAATASFELVTQLGSTVVLVCVAAGAAGILARLGRRPDAAFLVAALAGATALTWSLKALFQRERPSFEDPVATASSFSYPSGHALVSVAVYGGLAYLLSDSLRSPRARAACLGAAALGVVAIGFSRLYLGVHYLSDVVAGYTVGVAWLLLLATARQQGLFVRVSSAGWAERGVRISLAAVAAGVVVTAGCGGGDEPTAPKLPHGSEPVELAAADFVARIDNPYWPMAPGSTWVYREGERRIEVTVTDRARRILGIEATVVHDVVTEDGRLVEDTYDWYAQDRWGNVWYLGEDAKEYEGGEVVSTKGSWEAGVDGAQAGIVMPGEPQVGQAYRQEHYAGEAEDRGKILSLDEHADVPFGVFDRVLMTKDTTPLEPKVLEHKYYAEGVGPVLAVSLSDGSREELLRFHAG
jgi:membrane-associated phospholipid phosphatase